MEKKSLQPTITLRSAKQEDFDLLRNLHREAMREQIESFFGWDEDFQVSRLKRHFAPEYLRFIEQECAVIGCFSLRPEEGDTLLLEQFYVLPKHQGQGVGACVMSFVLEEASQQGKSVRLSVLKPSRARSLYERMGFVMYDEDDYQYHLRMGG